MNENEWTLVPETGAAGRTREELRRTAVPEGVRDVTGYFAGKHADW